MKNVNIIIKNRYSNRGPWLPIWSKKMRMIGGAITQNERNIAKYEALILLEPVQAALLTASSDH